MFFGIHTNIHTRADVFIKGWVFVKYKKKSLDYNSLMPFNLSFTFESFEMVSLAKKFAKKEQGILKIRFFLFF